MQQWSTGKSVPQVSGWGRRACFAVLSGRGGGAVGGGLGRAGSIDQKNINRLWLGINPITQVIGFLMHSDGPGWFAAPPTG